MDMLNIGQQAHIPRNSELRPVLNRQIMRVSVIDDYITTAQTRRTNSTNGLLLHYSIVE